MKVFLLTAASVGLLLLMGCQTRHVGRANPAPPNQPTDPIGDTAHLAIELFGSAPTLDPYLRDWDLAIEQVESHDHRTVYPFLVDLVASERFDELTPAQRHVGVLLTGLVGAQLADDSYAHHLLVRATTMPEAGAIDWRFRLTAACALPERTDCLLDLTTLLRRWPQELSKLKPEGLRNFVRQEPEDDAQRAARFDAMSALFDVRFTVQGAQPEDLWEELALEWVQRGKVDQAAKVVARISRPRELIAMRADRRFDLLVKADPRAFDLVAASKRDIHDHEQVVKENPRSLAAVVGLADALNEVGRFAENLPLTQGVTARIATVGDVTKLYDDGKDELHWLHQARAFALEHLGRWSEAEQELRGSADHLENGHRELSDVLNMAQYYSDWDHSDAARQMVAVVPKDTGPPSPYGEMQVHWERVRIAVSTHDAGELKSGLTYLRDHQGDSVETYEAALVSAKEVDDAATLLVSRLQAPSMRKEALIEVQHFLPVDEAPVAQEDDSRWEQIVNRPDVRAAIDAVGRREAVPLPP